MRQLLYVSESLVGADVQALDRIMVTARASNALDGITGLLWTDGRRFAQVLEGDAAAIEGLMARIRRDPRHRAVAIVQDGEVAERQFGDWAMSRPANDRLFRLYEQRMREQLAWLKSELGAVFEDVIAGSSPLPAG